MERSFKGSILLATLLVQPSASMYAMDSPATRDTGKARVFIGNDTWVSGHSDKIATFSRDMEEMRAIPDIDKKLSTTVVVGGIFTGFLLSYFFSLSTKQVAVCVSTMYALCTIISINNKHRYQEAIAQHVKELGLEVYTEKDADKIK
jgi:hypothetical protein